MDEQTILDITESAADLVGSVVPDCEGACLGTSAIVAYVLATHGMQTAAVRGEYDEHAHWWLETDTLRIDATRGQFLDGLPLVEPLTHGRDEDPYVPERSFPARWSRDQAVAEFTRMFEFVDVGEAHAWRILTDLECVASMLFR